MLITSLYIIMSLYIIISLYIITSATNTYTHKDNVLIIDKTQVYFLGSMQIYLYN